MNRASRLEAGKVIGLNPIRITIAPLVGAFLMPSIVYILYSAMLDKYYVGHTSDLLEERIRKHNSNHSGFTGRSHDWVPVYKEEFSDTAQAYRREREIKSWKSKTQIKKLISSGE